MAIGAPHLGAPKALRVVVTGDKMGLDQFMSDNEGLTFSRTLGSSPWLFPLGKLLFQDPEQSYWCLRDEEKGGYRPLATKEAFDLAGCSVCCCQQPWLLLHSTHAIPCHSIPFHSMPFHSVRQQELLRVAPKVLHGGPALWWLVHQWPPEPAAHQARQGHLRYSFSFAHTRVLSHSLSHSLSWTTGINLDTEVFTMVRKDPRTKTVSGLMLDTEASVPTHFVNGGIAYETTSTVQPLIKLVTGVEVRHATRQCRPASSTDSLTHSVTRTLRATRQEMARCRTRAWRSARCGTASTACA